MKAITLLPMLALTFSTASPAIAGAANGRGQQATTISISELDADTLRWMREEEKLARDVYRAFYSHWPQRVFTNIATSEQRHFDAIGSKLRLFDIDDPVLTESGQFSNETLQFLYAELTDFGNTSYENALLTGATIEDMDIRDLQTAIEATSVPSLKTTYGNLLEGSKNHLRSFVTLLSRAGVTYEPQYVDPTLYDAIINP